MKQNVKCYSCVFCRLCDENIEKRCSEDNYLLYTTQEDKKLCDLLCGIAKDKKQPE